MNKAAIAAMVGLMLVGWRAEAFYRLCIEDLEIPQLIDPKQWHPVGCEVIDCCPGCPGPGELEWHIRVEAPEQLTATLRFSNLGRTVAQLKTEGAIEPMGDAEVALTRGDSVIRGFRLEAGARPPVASIRWRLGKGARPAGDGTPPADLRARIVIEGRLGKYVVSRFDRVIVVGPCHGSTIPIPDKVRLVNNAGGDNAVILLDGKRGSGCSNDETWRASTSVSVGNVLNPSGCRSEAIVFSDDDAMQLVENVGTWTPNAGDVLTVDQTPDLINAPLHFWVMRGSFANTSTRVTNDLARANQLYNVMNCGTRFSSAAVHNATADPDTAALLNSDCGGAGDLRSRIGFTAGALNVYYLDDPGARGWWCGNNTIIIGSGADNESLSHEIGHAFSLGHTNGIAGMSATNLMVTGGTNRDNITEGQCFRCNANTGSTLNGNGNRVGPTRACTDATTSDSCPALSFDVNPN